MPSEVIVDKQGGTTVPLGHCCSTVFFSSFNSDLGPQCCATMILVLQIAHLLEKMRHRLTDMDGPITCSSLTLEREDHIIMEFILRLSTHKKVVIFQRMKQN
jgi:hypothetical protein